MNSDFLFEKEIRILGMKRSGNSAVLSFLKGNFDDDNTICVNNSNFTFHPLYGERKKTFISFEKFLRRKWKSRENLQFINIIEHMPIVDIGVLMHPLYFYNRQREKWASRCRRNVFSKEVYNIVLVRSFHNYLASVVRLGEWWSKGRGEIVDIFYGSDIYMEVVEIWLQYAREALGITNHVPDKIIILYDHFVSCKSYRVDISKRLGIPHNDSGISIISRTKSSFDFYNYRNNAQDMKVLDRWKHFYKVDYKDVWWSFTECREKILHPEIVVYNKALFGVDLKECFIQL